MSDFLGIDTSNYTTSAAIYESSHNVLLQEKMLLPVKKGEKGIFPLWEFHMLRGDWKAHICRAF